MTIITSDIRKLWRRITSMEEARIDAHPEMARGVKSLTKVIAAMERKDMMITTNERISILTEMVSINTDIVFSP